MNLESFRHYCLAKPATTEELPFGPDTLVLKVAGKMFALTGLDAEDFRINLKCEPQRALELRERHAEILPGWHMNKRHWNTVLVEQGQFTDAFVESLIDHSYELVVGGLPKKLRAEWDL